jgi:flagellar biosynthetic protein FliR
MLESLLPSIEEVGNRWLTSVALNYFWVFLLVTVRLSGLMAVGPLLGHSGIPPQIRVFLTGALALIFTPIVMSMHGAGSGADGNSISYVLPSTLMNAGWIAGQEFMVGMSLGLGVSIILSGIQLAGEVFDQQSGIALGQVYNPTFESSMSATGQALSMAAIVFLFCMKPLSGDLMMIDAMMQTFHDLPVGCTYEIAETTRLLSRLVHDSLVLAIQITAPMLAAQTLISLAMGFLGYSVPQINILQVGFGIRAMVSGMILIITFSGLSQLMLDTIPGVISNIANTFHSSGAEPIPTKAQFSPQVHTARQAPGG